MKKMLIISHFGLANGALSSLSYFGADSDFTAISAYENDVNPDDELAKFFGECTPEDLVLVFTDIMGGSVNQKAMPYMVARPNTYLFAGFNFPMLLQASALQPDATLDEIKAIGEAGKEGVVFMNEYEMPGLSAGDE